MPDVNSMPLWLQSIPTISGWTAIVVGAWLIGTGRLVLKRELDREKAATAESQKREAEAQAEIKAFQQTLAKALGGFEKMAKKRNE